MAFLTELLKFFNVHDTLGALVIFVFVFIVIGPYILFYRLDQIVREQREMYASNVELVKRVLTLAEEHQQLVIMNVQEMTRVREKVEDCPRGGVPK